MTSIPRGRLRIAPLVLMFTLGQTPAAPDVSTETVVDAAAAYVKTYQQQLTSLVADETYLQQIDRQVPTDPTMARMRRIASEMFFMFDPLGEWLAIRDVIRVDGQPVKDRPVVLDQLKQLPAQEVAKTFKGYNSRFNLGRTFRNFNEPTLVLRILNADYRQRFSFERKRVERAKDGTLVTLAFSERPGATLIHDLTFGSVPSKGELVVEAGTGRIRRTFLTAAVGPLRIELTTTFAHDQRLDIWVPSRFRERYEHGTPPTSVEGAFEYEDIVCDATYSNYRRFQTSGRIKKPPRP